MSRAKRFLSMLLSLSLLLGMLPSVAFAVGDDVSPFSDVALSDWYYDAAKYVYDNQLMSGITDTSFAPDAVTSRAMVVTVLYRMEGSPAAGSPAFPDVPANEWYSAAVSWASSNGIVSGYSDGRFAPNDIINREQMAVILQRYSQYKGYVTQPAASLAAFQDAGSVSPYAADAVGWAIANGILSGTSGNSIAAQNSATRGEIAVVLMQFHQGVVNAAPVQQPQEQDTQPAQDEKTKDGGNGSSKHPNRRPGNDDQGSFTVSFVGNAAGVGNLPSSLTVGYGGVVNKPDMTPTRGDGYFFTGWFYDSDCTRPFDYSAGITNNTVLYAGWSNQDNLVDDTIDLGDIEHLMEQGTVEAYHGDAGNIRMVDGKFTDKTVDDVDDARDVLQSAATLFGGAYGAFNADSGEISEQSTDGETFYRYTPEVNGVPVLGSQVILVTDSSSGDVSGLFSTYNDWINMVSTSPSLSSTDARSVARAETGNSEDLNISSPELWILPDDDPSLVYLVTVDNFQCGESDEEDESSQSLSNEDDEQGEDDPQNDEAALFEGEGEPEPKSEPEPEPSEWSEPISVTYLIDAHSGAVCMEINNIETAWSDGTFTGKDLLNNDRTLNCEVNGSKYRLRDTGRGLETYKTTYNPFRFWDPYVLPGKLAQGESLDRAAVSAHANMAKVYDYYKDTLHRDSFDGRGKAIKVSYDYGDNYVNAFWSSNIQQMVFGDAGNFAAAVDVAGHEFTHAVINYVVGNGTTTSLTYWGESGALNEAYADIMGSFIEDASGEDRWLLGEDADITVRDMSDPSAYSQPEHYNDRYTGNDDNGGVHTNSGIFNFAAYKMMTDSRTHDISYSTWAKVFYKSLFRLSTDANFLDARLAIVSTAKSMGFDHDKQQAIKDAFDDVGIVESDSFRIKLTWGATPRDLDSHIVGPGVRNSADRFHVFFGDRNYYENGEYYGNGKYAVDLDYDDVTSFGPEITTIHTLTPGTYYFYVHDFTNGQSATCTEMAASGATVKIYRGSSSTPIQTFTINPSSQGTYWNVFRLEIHADSTYEISQIETYSGEPTLS